uniref:Maestro heat-like repeat-containing protein family member 1 n=1 Tax=Clastoptera arizonana TaxID=38151 RepID=A0A1B6DAP1_9HEMI
MDALTLSDANLIVAINSLLEAAGDKEELVRNKVASSLKRLAKKYPSDVLCCAKVFREKNSKMTTHHLTTLLVVMEHICQEHADDLDDSVVKQLVVFSVDEMTKSHDYLPDTQFPASNMLVALGHKNCVIVMGGLVHKLQPGNNPHYTILHTMANLAVTNVSGFIPFIKASLSAMLRGLSAVGNDPIRQVYSYAFGKFSEAILEYMSNIDQRPDTSITKEAFAEEITTAYEVLISTWLQSKESKLIENIIVAVGPMFAIMNEDKQAEMTSRTINCIFGLYRRQNTINHYPLTQCLASILKVAPTKAIEPMFDQLVYLLGQMVVSTPDYNAPMTVKNHSEVLRCYDMLGMHFADRISALIIKQLSSSSERDKVEGLIVSAHLLSGTENVLKHRIPDIITPLRSLLTINSARVKKALLKTIVALTCRGNAENGTDFIEFLVRHCCPHPVFTGPEWDDLRAMCSSTVYLLSSTVEGVEPLLWSVLLRLLLISEYDAACATVARSLAHLAAKRNENKAEIKNGMGEPYSEAIFARCIALLGCPLNNNRGPQLLSFLKNYATEINPKLENLWNHKIPQLITYLEVSEWSESEWEALLLEFVSSTLQTIDNESWVILLASQICTHLPIYFNSVSDERSALLKTLALAGCNIKDRQIISTHLDVILTPLRTYSIANSKACADAIGILSRVHLDLVSSRLESLRQSELSRRSSRLLGLIKDNRLDSEVERARVTLLRCYAAVATQAPSKQFLPKLENGLIEWLLQQISSINHLKDASSKEATLLAIGSIADSLDRHREDYSDSLKYKELFLDKLLAQINNSSVPEPMLFRVTAAIVKLPPSITSDTRYNLLRSSLNLVFHDTDNSAEDKGFDKQLILKNFGILVEEILLNDVSPATLDDIVTLLDNFLRPVNTQQRAAAVYILRVALLAYYHNMKFVSENPSKFSQAGLILGRAVLRCLDLDSNIHSVALDCARLILLITIKYEGHATAGDPEIDTAFSTMQETEPYIISEHLGKIIASKLPHYQQNHFIKSLLEGLSDMEPVNIESLGEILVCFIQLKGGEMFHHINDILADFLLRLGGLNTTSHSGVLKAVLSIAKHHPKAVVSTLLSQALPLHVSICNCWRTLASEPAMAADVIEQFLHIMATTSLVNDNPHKDRPSIAALKPLAVVSAFREIFLVSSIKDLVISHYAQLFTLLFTTFATFIGVSPPVYSPSSSKSIFIPNRDAYKINPARDVQDALINFLICTSGGTGSEMFVVEYGKDFGDSLEIEAFLQVVSNLVRNICSTMSHMLPKLLLCLPAHANSSQDNIRVAVAAFNSECIKIQCLGQALIVDGVLNNLQNSLTDPSPLVRRISLIGLSNISYLDDQQRERHCESVLEALMQGLDDHDAASHGEIALQAMIGLSQVLPTIPQSYIRDIQVAVALRIKPFFEKDNVLLRTTSLKLLGELAQSGGSALPGFQDQVKASLVCLLMHLSDTEASVVKACKSTLRSVSNILEAERTAGMMNHLIDDATLQYQQFITDLAKLLVEEMGDQIPIMVMTALSYSKSSWAPIRGNSAIFIGVLYSNSPPDVREHIPLDSIISRMLQLIKDSDKNVRTCAAHAVAVLFMT